MNGFHGVQYSLDPSTEKEFMRYLLVLIGVAFTLMVQQAMRIFLWGDMGIWTRIACLSISAVFFAAHARAVGRLAIIYTKFEIVSWRDWRTFIDGTLWSLVLVAASHAYLIIIPCVVVLSLGESVLGKSDVPGDVCMGIVALDLVLLLSVICVAVYSKRTFNAYEI